MSTTNWLLLASLLLLTPAHSSAPTLRALPTVPSARFDKDHDHGHGHGHGHDSNTCLATADLAYRARLEDLQNDYDLALAYCANLTDPDERRECEREAREALREGQDEAVAQREARRDLCELLGGGPYDPVIDPDDFVDEVDNPYFPLVPGTVYMYRSETSEGVETDRVEVLHERKEILGVSCTIVHDVARLDGDLIEDTRDFFAQDRDGNVWYFGEATQEFEDGDVVSIEGSFQAGRDGAKAGIIMLASPSVGRSYLQEFALAEAEDAATVLDLDAQASVSFGSFSHCLRTRDFSPLEPEVEENKFYAAGIGSVLEIDFSTGERLELVSVTSAP